MKEIFMFPLMLLSAAAAMCMLIFAISYAVTKSEESDYAKFQKEAVFLGYGVGKGEEFQWIHRNSTAAKWFDETNKGE